MPKINILLLRHGTRNHKFMPLFQKSVVNKYLKTLDNIEVQESYDKFIEFYGDKQRLENIKLLKEENYQEGFLREIFVQV